MWGVVPVEKHKFLPALRNPSELQTTSAMATAMATCHSLTIIDGEVTGDPLDLKMFESINWVRSFVAHRTATRFWSLIQSLGFVAFGGTGERHLEV